MQVLYSKRMREATAGVLLLAFFVLPVLTFAGSTKKVYVDASASGTQNGSVNHPYKTIKEGLKHVNNDDELHVAAGVYKENVEIPYSVKLFGAGIDKTIIQAKSKDKPAVTMNHKTVLNKVTVKGGSHGVYVSRWSRASILKCLIKDSDKDGILIRNADTSDKFKVSVVDSEIKNIDRTGIFSEKRSVVIINTLVHDNGSDGVDISAGSKAWIDDNNFRDNKGSGLKVSLDSSSILVASKNTFRDNKHEGIEVNAYGQSGMINIQKSKFINNSKYGIARIARTNTVPVQLWKGLTESDNTFTGNNVGTVSPILNIR